MNEKERESPPSERKRSMTSLTLTWLSERLRRSEALKEQIQNGTYQVDSEKLAESLVNREQ